MISFKKLNQVNVFKLFIILVLFVPVNGIGLMNGLPLTDFKHLSFILIFVFVVMNIQKVTKPNIILFILILLFKGFFLLNTSYLWNVCVQDSYTPQQTNFDFEYFESKCAKSFDLPVGKYTTKVEQVSFKVKDYNYEWLGANSSNFPLGFLNHSAFNFYDLRRDWLPFMLSVDKKLEKGTKFIKINYIGYVIISFDNGSEIKLKSNYSNIQENTIKIPKGSEFISINYFFKDLGVKKDSTHPSTVPNDFTEDLKYAHFEILELNENFDIINKKNKDFAGWSLLIALSIINLRHIPRFSKLNLSIVLLIILSIFIYQNFNLFPDFRYIGYVLIFLISLVARDKRMVLLLLCLTILIVNSFLIDQPWDELDFSIKPSGSDILTYENQARLILEGDGLRGGADIFWYSPGYRYFLFLIHIIFGDSWGIAWKFILSLTILLIAQTNRNLKTLPFLIILFLVFDNVQNLYIFGLSETVALVFLLISLNLKSKSVLFPLFIAFATLIRPEILIVSLLLLLINRKNIKISAFLIPIALPLIHNLYFGQSFIPFSTAATYSRNINFAITNNLDYLIFNPFNLNISQILGIVPTRIGFLIIIIGFLQAIYNYYSSRKLDQLLPISIWLFAVGPYFIYDPALFYPRHVIISLVLIALNLDKFFFEIVDSKVDSN